MDKKAILQATLLQSKKKIRKKVPGQRDFLPKDYSNSDYLQKSFEELASSFGFQKVETPMLETEHILVHKNYFSGDALEYSTAENIKAVFRPTSLPGLIRMYSEIDELEREHMSKWFFTSPVIYQKHNPYNIVSDIEYGIIIFGDDSPIAAAQGLALGFKLYKKLGLSSVSLEVGSMGCNKCWPEYRKMLTSVFAEKKYNLCRECAISVDKNPERIFLCNNNECKQTALEAPPYFDYLDESCSNHLKSVLESLEELNVPYVLVPVSGHSDPIEKTFFRFKFSENTDSFYLSQFHSRDFLTKQYFSEEGKKPVLAMTGLLSDFVRAYSKSENSDIPKHKPANVVVIPLGDLAAKKSLPLFSMLWDEGIKVNNFIGENSLKVRLQLASDEKIPVALIIGQQEALNETVILRDVKSGMQEVFSLERILSEVKKRLGE